jgi:UDPglucose--hexose-1-phosphate uridylyltransferase
MSELRWNPLLGEWVMVAAHRQQQPPASPPEICPLCFTEQGAPATAGAEGMYDILVLEDPSASLRPAPQAPSREPLILYPVRPAQGICEVVIYSPRHTSTLAHEPVEQIDKLVQVWADRYAVLGALDFVDYVFIFENKGEAAGNPDRHPQGQIHAYPFIPPRAERELEQSRAHWERTGDCLMCDIVAEEYRDGRRLIAENNSFKAFIPFFARWPYEVYLTSSRHLQALTDLSRTEQKDLASIIKSTLMAFDYLSRDHLSHLPLPHIMAIHQRPTDARSYDYYHFHIEFYPLLHTAHHDAPFTSSQIGAGVFINDTLPEQKAAELRVQMALTTWSGEESPG